MCLLCNVWNNWPGMKINICTVFVAVSVFFPAGEVWDPSFGWDVLCGRWIYSSQFRSIELKCFGLLCWSVNYGSQSEIPFQGKILTKRINTKILRSPLFMCIYSSRWLLLRYVPNVSATSVQRGEAWTSPFLFWQKKALCVPVFHQSFFLKR